MRATGVIGQRVHPVTRVVIAHVAAVPAGSTRAEIREVLMDSGRDDHELAELRWVTAAEDFLG